MRVLISGGGTAGHINPAIAIAKNIEANEPGSEILFVGRKQGMEQTLVSREGYSMEYIDVEGLKRSLTMENVRVLQKLLHARKECLSIIDRFHPDLVVGTGGYVCVPPVMAANARHIKTLVHEQNVFPGVAVKQLAKRSSVTAISFSDTVQYLPKHCNAVLVGNPLRESILTADAAACRAALGVTSDRPMVLMFGGSLGAERMNDALVAMLSHQDMSGVQLIAATGEKHYDDVMRRLQEAKADLSHTEIFPYIYDMDRYFAAADFVITRAGAITISEITALGKASVLIPSPYVAHNHQESNARFLERQGAATVLTEAELCGDSLYARLTDLAGDAAKRKTIADHAKKLGITDACAKIYQAVR